MGGSGGIIGIKMKDPSKEEDLRRILLLGMIWWDEKVCRSEIPLTPGYLYGTWGRQDLSLESLPRFQEAAMRYGESHPTATFLEWYEDLYTTPNSEVLFDEMDFEYWLLKSGLEHLDPFNVREWADAINIWADLTQIHFEETWT